MRRRLIRAGPVIVGLSLLSEGGFPKSETVSAGEAHAGRTLQVGPLRAIKSLRDAAMRALDGDQVLVDPGEYRGDVAVWTQRGLSIRAAGGKVVLVANGASAEGKGIFVFRGGDALVENLAFTGARSPDRNGAGIRLDVGGRLTVRRFRFEDNENGILTSNDPSSELHLTDSEFLNNGAGDGQSHNVYVGLIAQLTVTCAWPRSTARTSTTSARRLPKWPERAKTVGFLDNPSGQVRAARRMQLISKKKWSLAQAVLS